MLNRLHPKILVSDNRVALAESEAGIQRHREITGSEPRDLINTIAAQSCKNTQTNGEKIEREKNEIEKKREQRELLTLLEQCQLQQRSLWM
jgi:hypothetical protein